MVENLRNLGELRQAVLELRRNGLPGVRRGYSGGERQPDDPDFAGSSRQERQTLAIVILAASLKILAKSGQAVGRSKDELAGSAVKIAEGLHSISTDSVELIDESAIPGETGKLWTAWQLFSNRKLENFWCDESTLGYIYQYFSHPVRKDSQRNIQAANKDLDLRKLVSFTQLYTPDWVVDFLVQNTVLPQWKQAASSGFGKYQFLLRESGTGSRLEAEELTVLDPACGSGHFLLRTFDLLLDLYLSEGRDRKDAVAQILSRNLAGTDIDVVGLWVTRLSLYLRGLRNGLQPETISPAQVRSCAPDGSIPGQSLMGSLHRDWSSIAGHPLNSRYQAVVTNPPYIGRKLMSRQLKTDLKGLYPESHQDLCAAFISRGLELLAPDGRMGLIGQASLMSLPTYGALRNKLLRDYELVTVVDAGPGVFPLQGGEKVNSGLFVLSASAGDKNMKDRKLFFDLRDHEGKDGALRAMISGELEDGVYAVDTRNFEKNRKYAFNYRSPESLNVVRQKSTNLESVAEVRQGLATSSNKKFLRYWWDVDPESLGRRWFPYVKGAGGKRWYAPVEHVVNWENGGAEIKEAVLRAYPYLKGNVAWVVKNERFYFREGLTFSFVSKDNLAVRVLPPGCIFDVGGSALFPGKEDRFFLLAYLNSSFMSAAARDQNPTINFQVGDVKRLPVLEFGNKDRKRLADLGREIYRLKKAVSRFGFTDPDAVIEEEAQLVMEGADAEQVFARMKESIHTDCKMIRRLSEEIDSIVQRSLKRVVPDDDASLFFEWLQREASLASDWNDDSISPADFSRYVLYRALSNLLETDGYSNAERSESPPQFPVLVLSDRSEDWLEHKLAVPPATLDWIRREIKMPVGRYLKERFQDEHRKDFRLSPVLVTFVPGDSDFSCMFSVRELRRITKSLNGCGFSGDCNCIISANNHSAFDPALVGKTVREIVAGLHEIEDWTGRDLDNMIRSHSG